MVDEHLDDTRLDGVFNLGVDEISYKRGHQYLTVVADHDSGRVLYVAKGRNQAALQAFFDQLGPERCAQVQAISMDMAPIWREPCATSIPQAALCFDPFHVIRWANLALDAVYKNMSRQHGTGTGDRDWRRTRYALRAGAERLDDTITSSCVDCAATATRSGAPGSSKNDSATSTAVSTPPTPAPISPPGADRPNARSCARSTTSPARSAATSTASSPPSNTACPTADSKASTPRSASSTAAATATPTATRSPP